MNKFIIIFVLSACLFTVHAQTVPRHRHTPVNESVDPKAPNAPTNNEAVAFSDTTNVSDSTYVSESPIYLDDPSVLSPSSYDSFIRWIIGLTTAGTVGIIIISLLAIIFLLVLFFPFILLVLILRYFVKRHNDKVALARMRMEAAATEAPSTPPTTTATKEQDGFHKGVRNLALGVGCFLMGTFWGEEWVSGIGILILCIGAGQLYLEKQDNKNNQPNT